MTYKQLFEAYKCLNWTDDPFGVFIRMRLEHTFGDRMRQELDTLHKTLYPRRKKINHHNIPADQAEPIIERWQEKALAYARCAIGRRAWLKRKLFDLAPLVTIEESSEPHLLEKCISSTYGSQGYGATKYARSSANRYAAPLQAEGFDVEIREIDGHTSERWGIYYADFEVWANLEPWQADVIHRRSQKSVLEWAVSCWKSGTNPKVYDPFLNDEIFDKSCAIAMGRLA